MSIKLRNIGLIGLGPHARRIYYPLIEKYSVTQGLKLVMVVELEGNEDSVNIFLENCTIQPVQKFFVERDTAYSDTLNQSLLQFLDNTLEQYKLDGIIVASDPKSHKAYLKWALSRNIDILVDKPITCPLDAGNTIEAAKEIELNFDELKELYTESSSNFIVQAQRRGHLGYLYIQKYLEEFISEFQLPISYIDISHADGVWVMPNEWDRENHPYKYGTGKLMHSGYHFVDLLAWFLELNQQVKEQEADELDMFVKSFNPSDFMNQLQPQHYERFLQQDYSPHFSADRVKQLGSYGELDIFMLSQLKRSTSVITTAYLSLQQNSFSRRAWSEMPPDIYKGNGRIRHERVNIQVSTLLNIQVHSYQSYQINNKIVIDYGPGHIDHFDILIFRNSELTGGKAFERIEIGRDIWGKEHLLPTYFSSNETARKNLFLDFLKRSRSQSDLLCHAFTNQLLSKIYECLALAKSSQMPYILLKLK